MPPPIDGGVNHGTRRPDMVGDPAGGVLAV